MRGRMQMRRGNIFLAGRAATAFVVVRDGPGIHRIDPGPGGRQASPPVPKVDRINSRPGERGSRRHDLLRLIVERHLLAGLHRGDGHDERQGVIVPGLDVRVGLLP